MALYDDLMQPQSLGLLGLAGGLLEAGGPSRMPVSLGQALNRGGLQGYGLARQGEQDKQAKAFQEEKMKFMQAQSLMEQLKYLQSLQPQAFNLRPGEKRFNPDGSTVENPVALKPEGPQSDVGKLMEDLKAGRITQAQFDEKFKKLVSHQPAATIENKINTFEPASVAAQREYMKASREKYEALSSAPATLKNIEAAKALIPQAKGFMGPGGETMLEAAKFLNNRLGMQVNTEGVKSAEELRSRIFMQIMDNLKKMDAQPSQQQQQVMQEALGKLGTDPNALPSVLDAFAEVIEEKVNIYNREVSGAEQRGVKFPYAPEIKLPERKKGAGKTYPKPSQAAINRLKMSPKERSQFEDVFGPGSAEQYLGR